MADCVICLGGLNLELRSQLERLPVRGGVQTASNYEVAVSQGVGTEALKLAASGWHVHMVSRLGHDSLGDLLLSILRHAKVNTTFVKRNFNCKSNYRHTLTLHNDERSEIIHDSHGCQLTVEDLMAARALFLQASLVVVDNTLPKEVLDCAFKLAKKYDCELRYADHSEPHMRLNRFAVSSATASPA